MIYVLVIVMTALGAGGAFFFKKASASGWARLLKNRNLYIGGALYLLSAVINIVLYGYMAYSVLVPLTALTYIWTFVLSGVLLKEKITRAQIAGIILITAGLVMTVFSA
jgi:drug/metabolite transporter (DMT)-like permease